MDDERVVVVLVEVRAVAVNAIADVPIGMFAQRVVHADAIPRLAQRQQAGFDHRREQQPVVVVRQLTAGGPHRLRKLRPDRRGQLLAQFVRRAQQRQRKKGGIDNRLPVSSEVHVVRRALIHRGGDARPRPLAVARSQLAFFASRRTVLQPGCHPGQGTPQGFQIGGLAPVLLFAGVRLHRHHRLQLALAQRHEQRPADPVQHRHPTGAVFGKTSSC